MQVASAHPPQIPFHFFPKSSSSTHTPSVAVKTRVVAVPPQLTRPATTSVLNVHDRPQPRALSTNPPTKRASTQQRTERCAKRARSSDLSDATPPPSWSRSRESSIASSSSSSRASTRNRSSPPTSLPPSTRSSSRSSSVLPTTEEPIPRECHIHDDAVLDDSFLSSEKVVLRLMKSYVQCWFRSLFVPPIPLFASSYVNPYSSDPDFKNPDDPHDRSFDPHPTDYPVAELEFPNSGATERYVILLCALIPYVHGVWQHPLPSFLLHHIHHRWPFLPVSRLASHQTRVFWFLMTRAHRPYLISVLNAACDAQHIYILKHCSTLHTAAACFACFLLPSPPPLILIASEHALSSTPTHQTSLHRSALPPVDCTAFFPRLRHKAVRQTSCKSAAGPVQRPRAYFLVSCPMFFFSCRASAAPPLLPDVMDILVLCLSMLTYSTQLHPSGSQGQRSL
jgi:hypothetical protein